LGYGYVLTEDNTDLFISSYSLGKLEKKIVVGSVIECTVAQYNNKIIATDIDVLEKYKDKISNIKLPDGKELPIRAIRKFGKNNAFKKVNENGITKEQLEEHGYTIQDLDYVFIDTAKRSYMFFNNDCPIKGDGHTDIENYNTYLNETLLKL
jgi:hypothetical protein